MAANTDRTMPGVGDRFYTPRFLGVIISETFSSLREANAQGYTEPTHNPEGYEVGGFKILGKSTGQYTMEFASARITEQDW